MKKSYVVYVMLTALILGIVMLISSQSTLRAAGRDGFYTSVYDVEIYNVGGQIIVVEELIGCAGPSGDCIMVTVTAKRIHSA